MSKYLKIKSLGSPNPTLQTRGLSTYSPHLQVKKIGESTYEFYDRKEKEREKHYGKRG